ncbi:hypothetical protein MRX96_014258 [Rhipicephalus microplus]
MRTHAHRLLGVFCRKGGGKSRSVRSKSTLVAAAAQAPRRAQEATVSRMRAPCAPSVGIRTCALATARWGVECIRLLASACNGHAMNEAAANFGNRCAALAMGRELLATPAGLRGVLVRTPNLDFVGKRSRRPRVLSLGVGYCICTVVLAAIGASRDLRFELLDSNNGNSHGRGKEFWSRGVGVLETLRLGGMSKRHAE